MIAQCRWCAATTTGLCATHLTEALRRAVVARETVRRQRALIRGLLVALAGAAVLVAKALVMR